MQATYKRHMGTDLDVVDNARVSFLKTSQWDELNDDNGPALKAGDVALIKFLSRGMPEAEFEALAALLPFQHRNVIKERLLKFRNTPTHWAPFANGIRITFHVKAPIPIMRQLFKHKVGAEESEVSRRYVDDEPEFFFPDWREAAENVKQGSGGPHEMITETWSEFFGEPVMEDMNVRYETFLLDAGLLYDDMIKAKVCPEQARFVLPQAAYTEAIISHSLYGWSNVFNQRTDAHAQKEIQDLTKMIGQQVEPLFPVSWKALTAPLD